MSAPRPLRFNLTARDLYLGCYCDACGWGGALTGAQSHVAEAARRGLSTLILGVNAHGDNPAQTAPDTRHLNVSLSVAPLIWRIQSWRVVGLLCRQLVRLSPPRVAFVARSPFWAVAARRVWPHARVAYVVPCILRHCLPRTWPAAPRPGLWQWLDYLGTCRVERIACHVADVVLTYTELERRELLKLAPAAGDRVAACRSGLPAARISSADRSRQRAALGLSNDAFTLLAVGVLDRNKAFEFALEALPATDRRARLIIAGDGPQRSGLERLVQRLRLSERVHLVGGQRDMAAWYAAADCVVSTSLYESYGYTLLEGMCFSRPALVPAHDPPRVYAGFAEIVATLGGGLLYDRTRVDSLAACVNRLLRDPLLYDCLAQQAREIGRGEMARDASLELILGERGSPLLQGAPSSPGVGNGSQGARHATLQPACRTK